MDSLGGGDCVPRRCDSSLSVTKVNLTKRTKKSSVPFVARKFNDPEIESLYHLHSTHRKRTELFHTFLYSIIVYSIIQIIIHSCHLVTYTQQSEFSSLDLILSEDVRVLRHVLYTFDGTLPNQSKSLDDSSLQRDKRDSRLNSESDNGESGTRTTTYTIVTFVLVAVAMAFALLMSISNGPFKGNAHIPAIAWLVSILIPLTLRPDKTLPLRSGLGWILMENFLIWVCLPIRLKWALCYSLLLIITHSVISVYKANGHQIEWGFQLIANLILLCTTNLLGILSFYLDDRRQRRAFLDTRQSLEMKLLIEEQAKEQEQLLLSVLPEHLATKMRQDMGVSADGQFKTVYMSRHENVSILYADIVGFTAISSTYSASELVKILNELFARFDKLAERYEQIRIKILGDCYYCICGAPEERTDHAVLSVHMGLSMVTAIKYVRESTKSPVDMRVGVHTGAILAGVLGQRQWQFDVYSKDVELANKMESSGMPGRVHISSTTLSFLNDEFEVEPANGEKREEILRNAGLKTFFIVRVLKPLADDKVKNGLADGDEIENHTFTEESSTAVEDEKTKESYMQSYRKRLKEELVKRDGFRDLSTESKWLGLVFKHARIESQFAVHKEPYAGISSISSPLALTAFSITSFLTISFNLFSFITAILAIFVLLIISILSASETSVIKAKLKESTKFNYAISIHEKLWVRRCFAIVTILMLTAVNAVFMIPCLNVICEDTHTMEPPLALPATATDNGQMDNSGCRFPAYLILFCAVFLFAITLIPQSGFLHKLLMISLVVVAHATIINVDPLQNTFICAEDIDYQSHDLIKENWHVTLYLLSVYFVVIILIHRLEKSSRVLFLWRTEVEQQREHAAQMRQKNEALVYNILPPHVAAHFLGARKRKHDELYSQSYSEVGILFASMPNFSDFYTEESVNNQGLECLRFLNEVISDFDSLLDVPRFAENIIKIKTISSTYMAASGLNPAKQAKPEDPVKIRWAHLSLLVEFAFELKRTLTGINEQSFNHFVLKMGINHGPAVAGVIGVKKPHYDIWGDTVNVASRMESTGKAGYIQVTEKTQKILCIYGYKFEQRGLVNVKGKGQLMTYYLVGRGPELSDFEVEQLLQDIE